MMMKLGESLLLIYKYVGKLNNSQIGPDVHNGKWRYDVTFLLCQVELSVGSEFTTHHVAESARSFGVTEEVITL